MKKAIKILPILMIVAVIILTCTSVCANTMIGDVKIDPNPGQSAQAVSGIGNTILGIIRVVGTIIAVGVLMVIGIKYMMGSAEEKAEYKKTMLPYLIGAIILFAAVNIAGMVVNLANTVNEAKPSTSQTTTK